MTVSQYLCQPATGLTLYGYSFASYVESEFTYISQGVSAWRFTVLVWYLNPSSLFISSSYMSFIFPHTVYLLPTCSAFLCLRSSFWNPNFSSAYGPRIHSSYFLLFSLHFLGLFVINCFVLSFILNVFWWPNLSDLTCH